jgi:hypothetical protein
MDASLFYFSGDADFATSARLSSSGGITQTGAKKIRGNLCDLWQKI